MISLKARSKLGFRNSIISIDSVCSSTISNRIQTRVDIKVGLEQEANKGGQLTNKELVSNVILVCTNSPFVSWWRLNIFANYFWQLQLKIIPLFLLKVAKRNRRSGWRMRWYIRSHLLVIAGTKGHTFEKCGWQKKKKGKQR